MEERYFYSVNGTDVQGPVTMNDLRQLFQSGAISAASFTCVEGASEWKPVGDSLAAPAAVTPRPVVPPPFIPPPSKSLVVKSSFEDGPIPMIVNALAVIVAVGAAALLAAMSFRNYSDSSTSISYALGSFTGSLFVIGLIPAIIAKFIKGPAKAIVRFILILGFALITLAGKVANIAADGKMLTDEKTITDKFKADARQQIAEKGYYESTPDQAKQTLQKLSDAASGDSDSARATRASVGVMNEMLAKVKICNDAESACDPSFVTITSTDDIAHRRVEFVKLHQAQADVVAFIQDFDQHIRDALTKENIPPNFVDGFINGAHKNGHIDNLVALWLTNMKLSDDYVAMLDFLNKGYGSWSVKDGKLIFPDDASLKNFQDIAKEIGDDAHQVGEYQKQLVN